MQTQAITRVTGLEMTTRGGQIFFVPHEYMGKEPDTKFLYLTIKKVAEAIGITSMHQNAASFICSDEENGLERSKRAFYWGKVFSTDIVGPAVFHQPTHVADNPGHSSNIYMVFGHLGMYKNEPDARLLYGKVESERDGVLRPTCGAIFHVMQRFLGKEQKTQAEDGDFDFIGALEHGLLPHKDEFLLEYQKGDDELEKHSLGMKCLVTKNVEVQVEKLLKMLPHNGNGPKLVFGGVTINRYKYSDTTLLTEAYLILEGRIYDLTKVVLPTLNANGSRHQAN